LHCLLLRTSLPQKNTMKRHLLIFTFSCASIALTGCFKDSETQEEISEIRQYIKGSLRTDINDIKDRLDTLEAGGVSLAEGETVDISVMNQRIQLMEEQLAQALEDIQNKNVNILNLENTLARLQGLPAPSPAIPSVPVASNVPPSALPAPDVVASPTVPTVDDTLFDNKVVQQYREQYPSSSSLSNQHITYMLGINFEARGQLDQLIQTDPTFEEKYQRAKELATDN